MEEIINSWKGWRLEFACTYGSDYDGVTEYSSYTSYDWTIDLAEIIASKQDDKYPIHWLKYNHLPRQYGRVWFIKFTIDEIEMHFGDWEITLGKNNRTKGYSYAFGHGDYHDQVTLLSPNEKQDEIQSYLDREANI